MKKRHIKRGHTRHLTGHELAEWIWWMQELAARRSNAPSRSKMAFHPARPIRLKEEQYEQTQSI